MAKCYVEGISWVLLYYYQGCPSWNWYYPYHYAPFAADFVGLNEFKIEFEQGTPFQPFEQLMSVLPAASNHNLPEVFRSLMSEPDSEIIDFYPEDFEIDMNGEKQSWRGIALLPFIDENRLLSVVRSKYHELTEDEKRRNSHKQEVMFVGKQNPYFKKFAKLYNQEKKKEKVEFSFSKTHLAGTATSNEIYVPNSIFKFPFETKNDEYPNLNTSDFMLVNYTMPPKVHGKSMILTGYRPHKPVLLPEDREKIMYYKNYHNNRYQRNNGPINQFINYKEHTGPGQESMYNSRPGGYKFFTDMYEREINHQATTAAFNQGRQNFQNMYQNNYDTYVDPNQGYNTYGGGRG
ncbi:hypothetical protein JL09_g1297, partial [Pichia kudriavzevii]